jgi:NAD(P)-dependent dehydrogenase (short-subunit alcohol dehydrogenase family)
VTSVAGKISVAPMAPYAASKFALEALAQELKAFGRHRRTRNYRYANGADIEALPQSNVYPQAKRVGALFKASLASGAATPELVAEKNPRNNRKRYVETPPRGWS